MTVTEFIAYLLDMGVKPDSVIYIRTFGTLEAFDNSCISIDEDGDIRIEP